MNTYSFILELLNNTAGIIVAIIAAATAFGVYSYKQNWNEKHKHYKALMESVSHASSKNNQILGMLSSHELFGASNGVDHPMVNDVKMHMDAIRLELPLARAFISRKSAKLFLEYITKIDYIIDNYNGDIIVGDPSRPRGPLQYKACKEVEELLEKLIDKLSVEMKRDFRIISLS